MKSWLVAVLTALTLISTAPSALSQDRVGDDGCGSLAPGECRVAGLRAQFGLGETQDLVRALLLFEDACAQGDSFACTEAGVAYATGFGTTIEPELARAFLPKGLHGGPPCPLSRSWIELPRPEQSSTSFPQGPNNPQRGLLGWQRGRVSATCKR